MLRRAARNARSWPLLWLALVEASAALNTGSSFVFRPRGRAGGNVFTTWPSLMTAMNQVAGAKTLTVDSSLVGFVASVPAGSYNLSNVNIVAQQNGDTLQFENGATVTATIWEWSNGIGIASNSSTPIWAPTQANLLFIDQSVTTFANVGKAPLVGVPAGVGSGQAPAILIFGGAFGDGVTPVCSVGAGSFADCIALANAGVFANAFTGAGTLNAFADASSTFQTQATGTTHLSFVDVAGQVAYTPASSANWNNSPPATVAAALDRIAAKIGPIP